MDSFWNVVLNVVSESGIWAMLFVTLLIILINSNNKREEKYQEIIRALANALKKVEEVKEDVEDIKFSMGIGGSSSLLTKAESMQSSDQSKKIGEKDDIEGKSKNI